jgi:cytochrome c peroxidase
MRTYWLLAGLGLLYVCSCSRPPVVASTTDVWAGVPLPVGFPKPTLPADNQLTAERIALGRKLFYEPALSRDSSLSCGSCHQPALAFSDGRVKSIGIEGRQGRRNAPSLANVAYFTAFMREGGVPSLEMQVQVPVQEHEEFDFNILLVAGRLQRMPAYVVLSQNAYGRKPDAFVITRAIAAFERSLISGQSPFDQYLFGGQAAAISEAAKRGYRLFHSQRLSCGSCHSGFLFTNQRFANNGLYEQYEDSGRYRLTQQTEDIGLFKIPSLRQVALTAPYMHDGSLSSLEAVIDHYAGGGKPHPNKSPLIKPFTLSAGEKKDLLAFLHSLTDTAFCANPAFQPPPD